MKYYIIFIFLLVFRGLEGQISIQADVVTGCKPLTVKFSIVPESARDTITSYSWNIDTWTLVKTDSVPSIIFEQSGVYTVVCTVNGQYDIVETNYINVLNCDSLEVANVFTPNDDNVNDFFQVKTDGLITYSFSVFSRSGILVYKSESPTIIWNGRSLSGQKMKTGIYFYIIRSVNSEPLTEKKGIVYLYE